MALKVGQNLPEATFVYMGAEGPTHIKLSEFTRDKKIALVGMPGAFTGTCNNHLPSFVRCADQLRAKGIDDIVVFTVNDIFALNAWGEHFGAFEAGIKLVADADSSFTLALDRALTVPAIGFYNRCVRFSAIVEDGVVQLIHEDDDPDSCDISGAENLLNDL